MIFLEETDMRKLISTLMVVFSVSVAAFAQNADAQAKAEQVIKQARAALGDESKLKSLQALSITGSSRRTFGEFQLESELEIEMMLPDKIKRTDSSQRGTSVNALNGDKLWNDFTPAMGGGGGGFFRGGGPGGPGGPGGQSVMANYFQQQQRREMLQTMFGFLITAPTSSQVQYNYVGEAQGPDGKLDVVDAKFADGILTRLYFDQQSHRLIGLSYQGKQLSQMMRRGPGGGPGGPGQGGRRQEGGGQARGQGQQPQLSPEEIEQRRKEREEAFNKLPEVDYRWAFADYKNVGGLNLPHRLTKSEGNTPNEEWEISKYKINPKLTADKFEKKEKEKAQN
jgi:hypothetical protein